MIRSHNGALGGLALGTGLTGIPAAGRTGSRRGRRALPRELGVGDQRGLDVVLREGRPGLAQVLRDGAQDDDLAPGEPGPEDERVEAVGLGLAVPHRADRVLEQLAQPVAAAVPDHTVVAHAQPEVVDVQVDAVAAGDLVGPLVDDLDAHVGEHRQHLGQRSGLRR